MDTVLRVAVTYAFIIAGLRIVGKRTFSQMSAADLVTLMLIPEFFSQAVSRDDFSMTNALVATSTLFVLAMLVETLTYRFHRLGRIVNGEHVTVVARGEVLREHADVERLSPEEIQDAMHKAGLEKLEQVKWAVLYPDGKIAVVPAGSRARATGKSASD